MIEDWNTLNFQPTTNDYEEKKIDYQHQNVGT
jgi:hypothetical protein